MANGRARTVASFHKRFAGIVCLPFLILSHLLYIVLMTFCAHSYGEQGAVIILQTLNDLFPHSSIDPTLTSPMRPGEFIQHILVPEVALALIQQDMNVKGKDAIEIMRDSSAYGTAMFPDINKEDSVGDKIMRERARVRRQEIKREEQREKEEKENRRLGSSSLGTQSDLGRGADAGRTRAVSSRAAKTEAMKNLQEDSTSEAASSESVPYTGSTSPPVDAKKRSKKKAHSIRMQAGNFATPRQTGPGSNANVIIPSDDDDTPKPARGQPRKVQSSKINTPSKQRSKAPFQTRPVSSGAHPLAMARARKEKQ